MKPPAALEAWATTENLSFAWDPSLDAVRTGWPGVWHVATARFSGEDDWIRVQPGAQGRFYVQLVAGAGQVETFDVEESALGEKLSTTPDWFRSWTDFFREGPGQGH